MAQYAFTFTSGDTVTPTKLNDARTVSEIVDADIKSDAAIVGSKLADGAITNAKVDAAAAIAGTKIAPNFGSQDVLTSGRIGINTNTSIRFLSNNTISVDVAGNEALFVSGVGSLRINSSAFGTDVTAGGWSFQNNGFGTFYRNTSTSTLSAWACYSDVGATKRLVYSQRADGNVLNFNNSYGQLSDASLKENVLDATPKLDDINKVRVVNFNFKGDDNKQIGVIAQEIEQVWPGIVSTNEDDGIKSVKYSILVPMLVKAVQELSAKVAALEDA
jgi:hypothetical protein